MTSAKAEKAEQTTITGTEVAAKAAALPAEYRDFADILTPVVIDPKAVLRAIFSKSEYEQGDPEETAARIAAQIIMAESLDAALELQEVTHGKDIMETPLNLRSVSWYASDYAEGANVFAVFTADRMDNGERVLVSCGSLNVLAFLFKWWHANCPEIGVQIRQATKQTKSGYYPLRLVRA